MTDKDLYKPALDIVKSSHANEKIYETVSRAEGSKKQIWYVLTLVMMGGK